MRGSTKPSTEVTLGAVLAPLNVASLSAKVKVERLMKLARGKKQVVILTHDNPDPD